MFGEIGKHLLNGVEEESTYVWGLDDESNYSAWKSAHYSYE